MLTPEYEAATKELYNVVIIEQKLAAKMKSDITYFVLMHEEYAETKRRLNDGSVRPPEPRLRLRSRT